MRTAAFLLCLAGISAASDLVYIGLNPQGAEEWYRTRDGAVVIRVPKGEYQRRPYEGDDATLEPKPHFVPSFFVDKYEVTNAQFVRFLNAQPEASRFVDTRVPGLQRAGKGWKATPGLERHPVTATNGEGVLAYAKWVGGAIPNPAQWEKAAGGAAGKIFPWGDGAPDAQRAQGGRHKLTGTVPVGSFLGGVSPYGCHDMAGNAYDRVLMQTRGGKVLPVMVKGGSWLSPNPLNLRVADMCVQPMSVTDRSVGFRCVMQDPEPDRATKKAAPPAQLELAKSWKAAVAEAKQRRVPIFLSLQYDTCGQCDRTRAHCFKDPRFVAYCNKHMVVVIGHQPAPNASLGGHEENEDGSCPIYPQLECTDHAGVFLRALPVVGRFQVSPGNFVLHPDRSTKGAGAKAMLVREAELPKWGNAVDAYLQAFERARRALADG